MEFVKINQPLLLISQIQRSGGSLMSQLFDGHKQIYAHPLELKLNDPKWDWSKFTKFYLSDSPKWKFFTDQKKYTKGKNFLDEGNDFVFDLEYQRKIFDYLNKNKINEREKLNAYFTSFFNAFKNYKNSFVEKKYISAFTPRINTLEKSFNKFFSIYPDGFFISIIRFPKNWLSSALYHSKQYTNVNKALIMWMNSTENSIKIIQKHDNAILINFENLITNPYKSMKKLANKIKINYEDNLILPTFNSDPTASNSSFKIKKNTIDKETLTRSSQLDKNLFYNMDNDLYNKCLDKYNLSLTMSLNI